MDSRLYHHERFIDILGTRGEKVTRVYFNPPESIKLEYPAIVYHRKPIINDFANNGVYKQSQGYEVTVIDEDPEGEIARKISQLPTCRHVRHFISDNLVHDIFELY